METKSFADRARRTLQRVYVNVWARLFGGATVVGVSAWGWGPQVLPKPLWYWGSWVLLAVGLSGVIVTVVRIWRRAGTGEAKEGAPSIDRLREFHNEGLRIIEAHWPSPDDPYDIQDDYREWADTVAKYLDREHGQDAVEAFGGALAYDPAMVLLISDKKVRQRLEGRLSNLQRLIDQGIVGGAQTEPRPLSKVIDREPELGVRVDGDFWGREHWCLEGRRYVVLRPVRVANQVDRAVAMTVRLKLLQTHGIGEFELDPCEDPPDGYTPHREWLGEVFEVPPRPAHVTGELGYPLPQPHLDLMGIAEESSGAQVFKCELIVENVTTGVSEAVRADRGVVLNRDDLRP